MTKYEESTDILIIGSGPVGSTFARRLTESLPRSKVTMLDAGPRLTPRAGMHIKNILTPEDRRRAQLASQGPCLREEKIGGATLPLESAGQIGRKRSVQPHPGTFLLDPGLDKFATQGMAAAAMSSNVGGMGAHWTCACPRFADVERPSFIGEKKWNDLYEIAEGLLNVTTADIKGNANARHLLKRLNTAFDTKIPAKRVVGPMPIACAVSENGERVWSGADTILGPLAARDTAPDSFMLREDTICLRLVAGDRGADYAVVKHLPTNRLQRIRARVIIVAADALRTPQLLWKSDFKSKALGHYLNDHPQSVCTVKLAHHRLSKHSIRRQTGNRRPTGDDPLIGMYWVPLSTSHHPFHGQIVHLSRSPLLANSSDEKEMNDYANLAWFCRKEIRFEDHIEFSETEDDFYGMPRMRLHYDLTHQDREEIGKAKAFMNRAAQAIGSYLDGGGPWTLPAGSSFHYLGTTRFGEIDNGQCVCDAYCQVWGTSNLFIGGNGIIPTSTASNPTLTSVALAIHACDKITSMLV